MQVDIYMGTEGGLVGANGGEGPSGVFFIPRLPSEMLLHTALSERLPVPRRGH